MAREQSPRGEIRATIKQCGFPKDEETLSVWFLKLYGRDFDYNDDGFYTGKDSQHGGTLAQAVKDALR